MTDGSGRRAGGPHERGQRRGDRGKGMGIPANLVITGLLLWLAFWWVRDVWERRAQDFEELANSDDPVHKGIIVIYWVATIAIVVLAGRFIYVTFRQAAASL